ncbi:MAG: Rpn family recombination-promoting nuclease/putative transposase [Candidatus Contendobacter sp.]|nr:Rpn family recombination-promoting nuclease/putative transposase [Candidatus Contendobacter sp.]MDG4557850.1 Rpn family recombination-promoting nuclease/putative transposase [Candidatus Contendobacter sp.]
MSHDDDASYKTLFSAPEVVRDLILGFVPDEWLHGLDYATLERVSGSYVTDDLRDRADDIVWRAKVEGEWVYLYILIEFQSTVDPWMAVRIMTYVGLLYQDLIKQKQVLPERRLPPVLPIVLYNGDGHWTAKTNVADLIPKAPGLLARYIPHLEYLLIDENRYDLAELVAMENLVAAAIRFERPESETSLMTLIETVNGWLEGQPELKRTFALWIRAMVLRHSRNHLVLPKVRDLKELTMTLTDRFDAWAREYEQKGLEKGLEKGLAQGESLLLQRQLARRFGPLPNDVIAQLGTATTEQLECWGDRVLDAASLEDVFRP